MTADLSALVQAVDHVGIAVWDLDTAIEFHCQTFGLVVTHREENVEQGVSEAMLMPAGDIGEGAAVQLLAPLRPDSPIGGFLERSGPGLQQLAYRVGDVEAVAASLRLAGVRMLYEQAKRGTGGSLINFAHPKDTGGVLVELVQPPPGARQVDAPSPG
ncbi:MAG: methylmalonyl-CoA epimerase [Ornithinimicrobium sp.]